MRHDDSPRVHSASISAAMRGSGLEAVAGPVLAVGGTPGEVVGVLVGLVRDAGLLQLGLESGRTGRPRPAPSTRPRSQQWRPSRRAFGQREPGAGAVGWWWLRASMDQCVRPASTMGNGLDSRKRPGDNGDVARSDIRLPGPGILGGLPHIQPATESLPELCVEPGQTRARGAESQPCAGGRRTGSLSRHRGTSGHAPRGQVQCGRNDQRQFRDDVGTDATQVDAAGSVVLRHAATTRENRLVVWREPDGVRTLPL